MRYAVLFVMLLSCASCGKDDESSPVSPSSDAPPHAQLACTVDKVSPDKIYAIVGGSEILCNAAGSTGDRATFVLDFGDGQRETLDPSFMTARHTFQSPGSYVIDVTVTDRSGRVAGASLTVVAKHYLGYWSATMTVPGLGTGLHRLAFDRQTGATIEGRYMTPDHQVLTVTGKVSLDRQLTFQTQTGVAFQAGVPWDFAQPLDTRLTSEMGDYYTYWPSSRW